MPGTFFIPAGNKKGIKVVRLLTSLQSPIVRARLHRVAVSLAPPWYDEERAMVNQTRASECLCSRRGRRSLLRAEGKMHVRIMIRTNSLSSSTAYEVNAKGESQDLLSTLEPFKKMFWINSNGPTIFSYYSCFKMKVIACCITCSSNFTNWISCSYLSSSC